MPDVIMPRLSDTMEEGELSRWIKQVGDEIHKGDVLAEIETDKATMDLEAFDNGILEQLLVVTGALVPIGAPVARIGDGSNIVADGAEPAAPAAAPAPAVPATTPDASAPAPSAPAPSGTSDPATSATPTGELRTSPLARKIGREHGIDLHSIVGTGPQGRITRTDVDAAIADRETGTPTPTPTSAPAAQPETGAAAQSATAPGATATSATPSSGATPGGPRTATDSVAVPVSRIRAVTARRLTESQAVPHFFLTRIVDVERLVAFRTEVNASLTALGTKVSLNDLFVRASAMTLRAHPAVNASWGAGVILRHPHVNVGVAVATDDGLLVPVVVDADQKSLSAIATETRALAGLARSGNLSLAQMSGGTFSISNLGMFDIDSFTAVLNPPEAGILAIGAAKDVPAVRAGALVTVPMVTMTLTADHRVLDGAVAAAFLRDLAILLEDPLRIVL